MLIERLLRLYVCLFVAVGAYAQTTPNIHLNLPNAHSPNWNVPLNANFVSLDLLLSGNAVLPGLKTNTLTLPFGATNPATCTAAQIFFNTASAAGSNLYGCTATNVWTLEAGGGGGGGIATPTFTGIPIATNGSNTLTGPAASTNLTDGATLIKTTASASPGAFNYNFMAAASFIVPTSVAAAPTANGSLAFDTVSHTYQFGNGTATLALPYFISSPPTTGNCLQSGAGPYQIATTGSPCGAGGGGITQLTGDVTAGPGTGSQAAALAAVGSAGSCGDSTHSCQLTFDAKGRETARANVVIAGGGGGGVATSITSGLLASLPATCTVGDVYFATNQPAGQQLYQCSAANTWTQSILLGASGALAVTAGALDIDTSIVCRTTNSCTTSALHTFTPGIQATPTVVASLGTCNGGTEGRYWGVTDATTTIALGIGTTVVGGGANHVPVYCNGTNWVIN